MAGELSWPVSGNRRLLTITLLAVVLLQGCARYAMLEELEIGMSLEEVLQLRTPCFPRAESIDCMEYSCQIDVPSGERLERRAIKPYILTFENGLLKRINLDDRELNRTIIRQRFRYGYGY